MDFETLFIDSHWHKYEGQTSRNKFEFYAQQLWEKAKTIEPFHLIDIKMAQHEIYTLKQERKNMSQIIDDLRDLKEELEHQNQDLQDKVTDSKAKIEDMQCSGFLGFFTCTKWSYIFFAFFLGVFAVCLCNCNCCYPCFKRSALQHIESLRRYRSNGRSRSLLERESPDQN